MNSLLTAPQIKSVFTALSSMEGDKYKLNAKALVILEDINYKLTYEDQTLRTFRRAIGFGQNVRSDLIPLLEQTKDYDVIDAAIRILVNLTVPVECLFSVDVMYRTEVGRHTIFELNKLLYMSKEAFTDPRSTKSIIDYMKHILESDSKLSPRKCEQINNCLLLLRNILHIPETNANFILPATPSGATMPVSMQNTILWNLFIQSIDKLLIYLMTCPQRNCWGVTIVQLIALMYKDQHMTTLQKLLNMWFEASLSESSEDNESNTSPPKQGSGDSSPMLTSDPTSDSSDNGGGAGGMKETSEERRQSLREETEATLQEVSRKGHEYQNSIMSQIPGETLFGESLFGDVVEEEVLSVEISESQDSDENEMAASVMIKQEQHKSNTTTNLQTNSKPAQQNIHTSTPAESGAIEPKDIMDAAVFMPPPALPVKSDKTLLLLAQKSTALSTMDSTYMDSCTESTPPVRQKVKHAGQLSLTKGKSCPQKRECPSSQSEISDCGYATQVENQESISTSSNDDDGPQAKPQHQKPPCNSKPRNKQRTILTLVDKKELRRKKLVKRSKSSLINMKGLVQHTPTDEDISNLLKEFTVDFLLKGYGFLVEELHSQLLTNVKVSIDTSHFFWLFTYFLKFATQLELDLEHLNSILTFDVISYLTYEGVTLCEQLDLSVRNGGSDQKPYLRRMHLVVTAIREFLQAIETYKKVTHLSEEDRDRLRLLQIRISTTEDLRCLFVLLLSRFNPTLQTKQYLQDLVVTNHILLVILDKVSQEDSTNTIKMTEHVSQFATLDIMHHYGMLLEDFNNNGEFVNNCIFTMMHHVGGDLGQISTLFQPVILKTFSRIWEADYELCDDWSDLIEYVIHKFMNSPQKSSLSLPPTSLTELTKEHNQENTVCSWTQEEMDTLYWYYVQSKKTNDAVGKIVNLFCSTGTKLKSRISIIQQLLQQDIITLVEYDDLMRFEDVAYQRALLATPTSSTTESGIEIKESTKYDRPLDDIQILLDLIIKEKGEKHITWLQKLLVECCYVKLILKKYPVRADYQNLEYIMEPVAYHCILKNKSIPIVQWNSEQSAITMTYQPFVLLLHKLGFQLPVDAGSIFARIPDFWTVEMMYNLAKKLGPLDKLLIKFDVSQLKVGNSSACHHVQSARSSLSSISSLEIETDIKVIQETQLIPVSEIDYKLEKTSMTNETFAMPKAKHCNSIIRFTPDPAPTPAVPNWLQMVMRNKCTVSNESGNSVMSTLVTASVAATMQPTASAATCAGINSIIGQCSIGNNNNNSADECKHSNCNNVTAAATLTTTNCGSSSNNINNYNTIINMTKATLDQQQLEETVKHFINLSDDDSAMKSSDGNDGDRNDSSSSGFCTRSGSGNLDSEYCAMVAAAYENELANSDRASVASDLTRMYVSDEEEIRHDTFQ